MDIGIGVWASTDKVLAFGYNHGSAVSTETRPIDVLVHYVMTWDGSNLRLYENGMSIASNTSSIVPRFHIPYYKTTILSMIGKFHSYAGELNVHSHLKYYGNALDYTVIMREYQEGPHR